jgi:hypothetical protein
MSEPDDTRADARADVARYQHRRRGVRLRMYRTTGHYPMAPWTAGRIATGAAGPCKADSANALKPLQARNEEDDD